MKPSEKLTEALAVIRSGRIDKGRQKVEVALKDVEKLERELAKLKELMGNDT